MNPNHRRMGFSNQTWTRRDSLVIALAFGTTLLFYASLALTAALIILGVNYAWEALT